MPPISLTATSTASTGYTYNIVAHPHRAPRPASSSTSNITFTATVPTTLHERDRLSFQNADGHRQFELRPPRCRSISISIWRWTFRARWACRRRRPKPSRMQNINPDNYIAVSRPAAPWPAILRRKTARAPTAPSGHQTGYPTNNYCLGYCISRVSQAGYANLLDDVYHESQEECRACRRRSLPDLSELTPGAPNSLVTGHAMALPYSLTAVTSCPTDGTDTCIQLRLDAVGYALTQLITEPPTTTKTDVTNQFRIGLYPFITNTLCLFSADQQHQRLTDQFLDHQLRRRKPCHAARYQYECKSRLRRHAYRYRASTMNTTDQTPSATAVPRPTRSLIVFLVTDGAQDPQTKGVPNGGWSGSNHATADRRQHHPDACTTLKSRGIIISVLYIPYQTIRPCECELRR